MTLDIKQPLERLTSYDGWQPAFYVATLRDELTGDVIEYVVKHSEGDFMTYRCYTPNKIRNTPEPKTVENWWELPVERLRWQNHRLLAVQVTSEKTVFAVWYYTGDKICPIGRSFASRSDITILPPRKSLGWVNVYDGSVLFEKRNYADNDAEVVAGSIGRHRLACVEIFEGDGI